MSDGKEEKISSEVVIAATALIHLMKSTMSYSEGIKVLMVATASSIEATRWAKDKPGMPTRQELMDYWELAQKSAKIQFDIHDEKKKENFSSDIELLLKSLSK